MLVLTRDEDEDILIGDNIVVKVVGVNRTNGQVRLGIEAPRNIAIDRREVRESKEREQQ
jgi:carbon storage regulator